MLLHNPTICFFTGVWRVLSNLSCFAHPHHHAAIEAEARNGPGNITPEVRSAVKQVDMSASMDLYLPCALVI